MNIDEINALIILGFVFVMAGIHIYIYGFKNFWKNLF